MPSKRMHGTEGGGTGERGEVRDPVGEGVGPGEDGRVGAVSDGLSAESVLGRGSGFEALASGTGS